MKHTQPQSFDQLFADYSMEAPQNETVLRLNRDPFAQIALGRHLSELGQTRFINLTQTDKSSASITMPLYAGDGIVTKITPIAYAPMERLPLVLFSFAAREFAGTDRTGSFMIEHFPCIKISHSRDDVNAMKDLLAQHGLVFSAQDDRPENIGRLADGSLAVLDGDAVRPATEGRNEILLAAAARVWTEKLRRIYPELYDGNRPLGQSQTTDFDRRPYVEPQALAPAPQPPKLNWLQRLMPNTGSSRLES